MGAIEVMSYWEHQTILFYMAVEGALIGGSGSYGLWGHFAPDPEDLVGTSFSGLLGPSPISALYQFYAGQSAPYRLSAPIGYRPPIGSAPYRLGTPTRRGLRGHHPRDSAIQRATWGCFCDVQDPSN